MTRTTWHQLSSVRASQLAVIVLLCSSTLAFNTNTALARPAQQQVIVVDDRDIRNCLQQPCPQPFEIHYDANLVQGFPFNDSRMTDTTYNDHAYWAQTRNVRNIVPIDGGAIWRPFVGNSSPARQYRVSAFIPRVVTGMADTRCARYSIRHADGETSIQVDQAANVGTWISLGTYRFLGSESEQVDLDWNVDPIACEGASGSILFDAVRFEPVGGAAQPISVRAFLRDLAEGATVVSGTTVWHCFSISRAAPIRWWWQNPSAGWQKFAEWDDDGQGACRESNTLAEPGIRRIRIEALQDGQVVAQDETYFYVDDSSVLPTTTPRPQPTVPTAATATPTPVSSIQVWIETGCGRTYSVGQSVRVGVQADAAGIARLSFQPQGIEFAVRSLRAGSAEVIDTVVEGPPGAQSIEARLEVASRTVATAACDFRVRAPQTSTPQRPPSTPAVKPQTLYLPVLARAADSVATPTSPSTCFNGNDVAVVRYDARREVAADEPFTVNVTFRNDGRCSWVPRNFNSLVMVSWLERHEDFQPLPREVPAGGEIEYHFALRAPQVTGTFTVRSTIAIANRTPNDPARWSETVVVVTTRPTATPASSIITVSNAHRLSEIWAMPATMSWLETVDFSPSGGVLAWGGGGDSGVAEVLEGADDFAAISDILPIFRSTHVSTIASIEVLDNETFLAAAADNSVTAWDYTAGRKLWHQDKTGHDLAVKPDGTHLVTGGTLWSVSSSGLSDPHFLGWQTALPGGYSASGQIGLYNSGLVLYDEGAHVLWRKELPTESGWFHSVSFSNNNELVATSDSRGSTYVWRVRDGTELMRASGSGLTHGAALSPAGDVVATAFDSGDVAFYATADGRLLLTVPSTNGAARALQFAPNGRYVAVGYDGITTGDPTITVLGLAGGVPVALREAAWRAATVIREDAR